MGKCYYEELNTKKKIAHFWYYYKTYVLVAVCLIALAVVVYVLRPIPGPQPNLRITFVNAYVPGLRDEINCIEEDYEAYLGMDNACQMAFNYYEMSMADETKSGMNMEDMMLMVEEE